MKKSLLSILIICISFGKIYSQNLPSDIATRFFNTYEKSGASKALDELYSTSKWISKSEDAILKLKNQMEGFTEDYMGKYYGYEFITEKKISDSFHLLSYLVKFDRQPLRYTFEFYKPAKEWKIYSFQYDGNLSDELEESAKIYYINYQK